MNFTVIVPFWNGHATLGRLLDSLPPSLPVIIVDDWSDRPPHFNRPNTRLVRPPRRGYFAGAVNAGAFACQGDFLILNQDSWLEGRAWLDLIAQKRSRFATIGHGVMGHKAWPNGYIQGTFMFVRRDAWDTVGPFNATDYPLWGTTCEWQLRACRRGYEALPLATIPGFHHDEHRRKDRRRFGSAITSAIRREPSRKAELLRTPPMMSVVVPCYNYGHYLNDAINSLIGGETSLGRMDGQTFQSFEIVIVDDASTDDSWQIARGLADGWKGIRAIQLKKNRGTPGCLNAGVRAALGKFIHILSADDMREPWALERLLRAAQDNPHSFAFSSVRMFKDGERVGILELPEYDFDKVVRRNLVSAGIVYPKAAWEEVGGYPEIMTDGREDWAFNVGMGRAGWCGVKVDGFGNLYRRERQNRSWRTGNKHKNEPPSPDAVKWRKHFVGQMKSLYPKIYRGERPVGCCGKNGAAKTTKPSSRATKRQLPVQSGMTILEYVGGGISVKTYWGTRTTYRFGGSRRCGYVANEDVEQFLEKRKGREIQFVRAAMQRPAQKPIRAMPEIPKPSVSLDVSSEIDLAVIPGIGQTMAQRLTGEGYGTVHILAAAIPSELVKIKGISHGKATAFIEAARQAVASAP